MRASRSSTKLSRSRTSTRSRPARLSGAWLKPGTCFQGGPGLAAGAGSGFSQTPRSGSGAQEGTGPQLPSCRQVVLKAPWFRATEAARGGAGSDLSRGRPGQQRATDRRRRCRPPRDSAALPERCRPLWLGVPRVLPHGHTPPSRCAHARGESRRGNAAAGRRLRVSLQPASWTPRASLRGSVLCEGDRRREPLRQGLPVRRSEPSGCWSMQPPQALALEQLLGNARPGARSHE